MIWCGVSSSSVNKHLHLALLMFKAKFSFDGQWVVGGSLEVQSSVQAHCGGLSHLKLAKSAVFLELFSHPI